MKRLLAYLFIVLGLGLTFNVNAEKTAKKNNDKDPELFFCKRVSSDNKIYVYERINYPKSTYLNKVTCNDRSWNKNSIRISVEDYIYNVLEKHLDQDNLFGNSLGTESLAKLMKSPPSDRLHKLFSFFRVNKIYGLDESLIAKVASTEERFYVYKKALNKNGHKLNKALLGKKIKFLKTDTQIAKAEPSQTQKVVKSETYCLRKDYGHVLVIGRYSKCSDQKALFNGIVQKIYPYEIDYRTFFNIRKLSFKDKDKKESKIIAKSFLQAYLASKKPSQTQKVAKKVSLIFCEDVQQTKNKKYNPWKKRIASNPEFYYLAYYVDNSINSCPKKGTNLKNISFSKFKEKRNNPNLCYDKKKSIAGTLFVTMSKCSDFKFPQIKYDGSNFYYNTNQTQIAKAEPTVKPKKKVKVAKVEDSTQEEFKPKKTNQDNEAPVIEIAEVITVNDSSYEIEGSVSDNSKNIFVQVDGRTIPVKKGKFKIKRFSPIDEQIEIIATDQWGNRSSPKMVSIIIDQKDTIVADTFENLDPSKIRSRSNKNRVALIIGIEKYDQTPDATFANLDAQYFYEYARKGFGISKSNIKLLVDEDANLIQSLGTLSKWLPGKIKDGKTELIIFFAGHGLASNDGKELYLLPQDSDPDLLSRTALSRTELFKEIIALNPKSVTMFLDTCYSGVSRDEKTLLASARPIRIKADEQDTPNNFTIFSASQLDQISSGFKEAKHGIFSYYLMKGLEGKADANNDKDITNGELLAYMDQNVAQKASELGRQQNPSLAGDPDKILMSYR